MGIFIWIIHITASLYQHRESRLGIYLDSSVGVGQVGLVGPIQSTASFCEQSFVGTKPRPLIYISFMLALGQS